MAKGKGRAHLFQDPDEQAVKDYDPEANAPEANLNSDSEASGDENVGTEHYEAVSESKLRRKEGVSLGPKYRGARVSRAALEQDSEEEEEDEGDEDDEEYDDPETADLARDEAEANDSEIESDDALGESDRERFKDFTFRGSKNPAKPRVSRAKAADFMSSSGEEDGGSSEDDEDANGALLDDSEDGSEEDDFDDGLEALADGADSDEDEEDDEDDDDEEGSEDDESEEDDEEDEESDEEDGKKSKSQKDAKPMLGALSNTADVEKGLAIRQQRKFYDGLLNLRIRLQKALIATNTFPVAEIAVDVDAEPYEAAEEAAVKLLNTISSLKDGFGSSARAGDKRKRELEISMSSEDIWSQLQEEEQRFTRFREDRLEKWSRKVQAVNVTTNSAAKGFGSKTKSLTEALQDQLADPDNKLLKRTKVPRSCAPTQAARKVMEDADIYDDADFYQLLLKELVDQRTVDTAGEQNTALPSVMVTASKEAKNRKVVDRKASKGRKMRFTVHEKLQNFMAPEDRRSWEQDQIDRFFGTLFGRKMELNEESDDEDMEDIDAEEEGLRLFRN
ncbi:apoptosis-antagonizing transcription factor [Stachybotrys elegans]|uniref:Protein BFR2 n=1 Tax=Stachybotrys elegans TaxID=80388 RepID=A0A8K0SSL0_9HYPO|nr:apoptosis-antagonizing transcription factor [Stachybotrys elegans]